MTPRKILFCADFSENSQPAYRSAVDYTKAFGAQLIIAQCSLWKRLLEFN